MLEPLEDRIAPASVLTFTDTDGDSVKITSDVGTLSTANVKLSAASGPAQLYLLDLSAAAFKGAKVTITSTKAGGGDGFVNVGRISSPSHNLESVTVDGDVASLIVGDTDPAKRGIGTFTARSFGAVGTNSEDPNGTLGVFATVVGGANLFDIAKDITGARLDFQAGNGSSGVGMLRTGGSIDASHITVAAELARLTVKGDLRGGSADDSGRVAVMGTVDFAHIYGSIIGAGGERSGSFEASGAVDALVVDDSIVGGQGGESGSILCKSTAENVQIGGDVEGGAGMGSGVFTSYGPTAQLEVAGYVRGGEEIDSGAVLVDTFALEPASGSIEVGKGIIGGSADGTGRVFVQQAKTAIVRGAVVGGSGENSGQLSGSFGEVAVLGDVVGGTGQLSGMVGGEHAESATIDGDVVGGLGEQSGLVGWGATGKLKITGDIRGANVSGTTSLISSGTVNAFTLDHLEVRGSIIAGFNGGTGNLKFSGGIFVGGGAGEIEILGDTVGNATNPVVIEIFPGDDDVAIDRLTIHGDVVRTDLLFGSEYNAVFSPDTIVNEVVIGGKWTASNLAVGVGTGGDGFYGTRDDTSASGGSRGPATLKNLFIAGKVSGSATSGDHFGIASQYIVKAKIKNVTLPLKVGPANDEITLPTGDFTLREAGVMPMG
ncbi:MAG: hypothetical protein QOE70_6843 [Chthoniobacter sp.]|jgi:hypothetical protein|nr:hypothetical protein [Chthoniobacter sp.]